MLKAKVNSTHSYVLTCAISHHKMRGLKKKIDIIYFFPETNIQYNLCCKHIGQS